MSALARLIGIMRRLRDPADGCPWDREQDFDSIAPYTIEEAYEVEDAIRRKDMDDLRCELGDLLLQVVYHAQMADEQGLFDFDDVAEGIAEKLVRRHPHVFGDATTGLRPAAVRGAWEDEKARERAERAQARSARAGPVEDSLFDGIPMALPGLMRAAKLISRAGREGMAPTRESELTTLERVTHRVCAQAPSEPRGDRTPDSLHDDVGRLLFALVGLSRSLGVDAESALRDACAGFEAAMQRERNPSGDD